MKKFNIKMKIAVYIFAAGLIVIDRISKGIILDYLYIGEKIPVIKNFFYITYCRNTGGAWSIFPNSTLLLGILSAVSSLIIIGVILLCKKPLLGFSLGMILGGALGNMIDRFWYGYVVDFLDFLIFGYNFPVFNFADICIVIGGIGLIFVILFSKQESLIERPPFFKKKKEDVAHG